MRILRTKGMSFTEFGEKKERTRDKQENTSTNSLPRSTLDNITLQRGLHLSDLNDPSDPRVAHQDGKITPNDIGDYLEYNHDLALRQIISVLDKIIQKPKTLSKFNVQAYVDRTRLSEALWSEYATKYLSDHAENSEYFTKLQKRWRAKIHPYARYATDWGSPETDENAVFVRKWEEARKKSGRQPSKYVSRWAKAFGIDGRTLTDADHSKIANHIFKHLFERENTLSESRRHNIKEYGLVHSRGFAISESTNNPAGAPKENKWSWDHDVEEFYFSVGDIAREIFLEISRGGDTRFNKAWFGKKLYEHYGRLIGVLKEKNAENWEDIGIDKDEIRNLHNRIRDCYRRIAEGSRLRIVVKQRGDRKQYQSESDNGKQYKREISKIIPKDKEHLLSCIVSRKRNVDINSYIRLGKAVAHAADLEKGHSSEAFEDRLRFYITSAGQSEIKRNETFIRVWRTCVAFSLRTLRPWADPQRRAGATMGGDGDLLNYDLASANVAKEVLKLSKDYADKEGFEEHFETHTPIILGSKDFVLPGFGDAGISRASLFRSGDVVEKREVFWAMLRLAGEIRDRTIHFNTKHRLMDVLTNETLRALEPGGQHQNFESRPGNRASEYALQKIGRLLEFDLQLEAQVLADDLNRLELPKYLPSGEREKACNLLCSGLESSETATPKFMRVLRRVEHLAQNDDTEVHSAIADFANLDLSNQSKVTKGLNHFRIGYLRLLYDRPFTVWLDQRGSDHTFIQSIIGELIKSKRERISAYGEKTGKEEYIVDSRSIELLNNAETLKDLLAAFVVESMQAPVRDGEEYFDYDEGKPEDPYTPDKERQQSQSSWLEKLRQELFAHLFARFIADTGQSWIWRVEEPAEDNPDNAPFQAGDFPVRSEDWQPWHRQFYAWLYLVPVDQVSLLRNQFRKSRILETKAREGAQSGADGAAEEQANAEQSPPEGTDPTTGTAERKTQLYTGELKDLDRLMGLYTAVQSAGFSGREHLDQLEGGDLFYANPETYNRVYSDDFNDHHVTVPGTRRGIRQILRFGTLEMLKKTIGRHNVTDDEVRTFIDVIGNKNTAVFEKKNEARKAILAEVKSGDLALDRLQHLAGEYRAAAIEVARHNFKIGAARLTEFAKLNHLLMEIIARLADFSGMWERDYLYTVLGMLFSRYPASCLEIATVGKTDRRQISLVLKRTEDDPANPPVILLIDDKLGFVKAADRLREKISDLDDQCLVRRYFDVPVGENGLPNRQENPRDRTTRQERNDRNKQLEQRASGTRDRTQRPAPPIRPGTGYKFSIKQVRNDLAHFNVLDTKLAIDGDGYRQKTRESINLTYLVNAVRALMSYDRKMKNAVSKAIADIVFDEGLEISWRMDRDRLSKPVVMPRLEKHLDIRGLRGEPWGEFALPRTSMRYASMVQALFDFGSGGHSEEAFVGGKKMRKLTYPKAFLEANAEGKVPDEVLLEPQNLPQKSDNNRKNK